MATQMQRKEIAWPPGLLERKNSRVFSDVIFDVYTHVDNGERAERVIENKRDEFCRKKNMKIQSGCETIESFRSEFTVNL